MSNRPQSTKEAFEHGKNAHCEGMNPFRNTGVEDHELYNAWVKGFEQRQSEQNKEEDWGLQ